MGAAVKGPEQGRGGQEGIRDVLQSGGATGATVRVGDVGADPTNREGAEQLHAWAALRITGRQPRRGWDVKWYYPSLVGAIKEAGFTEISKSITNRQNTVAQHIATRTILYLCERTTQRGGARVYRRW